MLGGAKAQAKGSDGSFDTGYKLYMAANCADAMEPLYQSTLRTSENKDRALLYLAHCQSIFLRDADAAYNLDRIKSKNLVQADQKLYKDLSSKHKTSIEALHKLYFNLTPYAGQSTVSPSSVKGAASFYGLSLGVSRPEWSVGAFYESFSQKFTPAGVSAYSQSMMGAQLGYFVLPSWRVSGSYTSIHGNNDQMNSVGVAGLQTDYYFTPFWTVFLEYYASSYPKLLSNLAGVYQYSTNADQMVAGVGFPIVNGTGFGVNGSASYTGITLKKSSDPAVYANPNLSNNTARYEAVISAYYAKVNGALTYWSGKEVLGVRSRGAVVMDNTDLHKGGSKVSLGYTISKNFGVGASYGMETYTASDIDGTYKNFQSGTTTGMLLVNW